MGGIRSLAGLEAFGIKKKYKEKVYFFCVLLQDINKRRG
jgi:hypothetical protein